ncbi:piggyBac transposable element-derived protein 4-like [Penaeus vannamei]|uniref:piggyBac transposable element-derived protein 4-like n=1 Tax=Penaeus vannamei TaxID=6689 RepID=UPI00387FA479
MPTDLQAKGRGSVDFRSTDFGMLALQWLDKRPVTMLSTVHTSEMVALPLNRQGIQRIKPKVVTDYNNGMKGIDFSDQLSGSYKSTRKTIKWYKKKYFSTFWTWLWSTPWLYTGSLAEKWLNKN